MPYLPSPPLDMWARCGAVICPHDLRDMQRCITCNVIKFDRPLDALKDVPFEDLLLVSPRHRPIPNLGELAELTKRIKGENALIELDAKTHFKKQRDYVLASITNASKEMRTLSPTASKTIEFAPNIVGDRTLLFPREEIRQLDLRIKPSDAVSEREISPVEDISVIRLASTAAVNVVRVSIHRTPFGNSDPVKIEVGPGTTVAALIEAVNEPDTGKQYELRWTEDDEEPLPDYDLPAIDADQYVVDLNATDFCLCEARENSYDDD